MKNHLTKGRNLVFASTGFILILFYLFSTLHASSMYYLYYMPQMTCMVFFVTNILLMLLKYYDTKTHLIGKTKKVKKKKKRKIFTFRRKNRSAEEKPEEILTEEIAGGEDKGKKKKKRKFNIKAETVVKAASLTVYFIILFRCIRAIIEYTQYSPYNFTAKLSSAVFMILMIVASLVLDRFCKYSTDNTEFVATMLKNCRAYLKVLILQMVITAASIVFEYVTKLRIQKIMGYVLIAVFIYAVIFIVISLVIVTVRKDYYVKPFINIPFPSLSSKDKDEDSQSFIDYLEKNTGISMRSLWSVKYIKEISPVVVFVCALVLWLSTGVVSINSYQQAAVYRIGVLQKDVLTPGIHLTLPYPFDKVEIYDTEALDKMTIGYKSEESTNNIWTASHGEDEYKLLLGGGDELVSINIRLEYKISDLYDYLTVSTEPEKILEGLAYELVMDKTISTDLSSLLSINRYAFANNFKQELSKSLTEKSIGIEVVSVVLESIHPPVEIAHVYQDLISAGITAEKYILDAQAQAAVLKADAQSRYNTDISKANAEHSEKVSQAKSSVAEFMASVGAYKEYGDAYTYQKYLNAVRNAYGKANLVILGDDIDKSSIIFGSFYKEAPSKNDVPSDVQ